MQLLVRVAEAGSMTRAAQQLHLTPAAVSAAIQRIETSLGVRMFERTTRSLQPTDEGLVIIEGCVQVVEAWQRTLHNARGEHDGLEGSVHLSAPADTTYQVLQSVVAEFAEQHPKVRIVLHSSDVVQHLHRDAIDMAIRYGALQDSTLSARRLAASPSVLAAAPAYLDAMGTPETVDALVEHRCLTIQLYGAPVLSWTLHREAQTQTINVEGGLCGDGYIARQWALQGRGIVLKSLFDIVDDLEAGRLVQVLPEYTAGPFAIHAVFPSRRFLPARVRALDNAITQQFNHRSARCEAWLARA